MTGWAATVGADVITVADVDAREDLLRAGDRAHALPGPGTGEARQLRRWLTQVLVAERIVAASPGADPAPSEQDLLLDEVGLMELGSVAAATLATPHGRAVYASVTAEVQVGADAVSDYFARNPYRFAHGAARPGVWRGPSSPPRFDDVRALIHAHLLAAARRREYRRWLDAQCAALVTLADGYEHPGDPRQPDNTHRH
ncbi:MULTISPECIES: DUF7158 domain-containing protein [Mycolicibacterium]|uniref:Putative malonyl CoA-acyl carrier protein transacylase FabD2 (MCT) n=1 Tax=Mycolicibacterium gilvum (strain PYR-GCK) TaxID=350054 RepID=A4T1N7_MYCGI|nr:hypothetical protein [Mycolicibacterium sp. PAM1]ABP47569.1 putative malonyl CoA-acyl carrier protein transacylase FabD2 (MCT) [Mycolicibacterium gilvum PYR-GCK]MBV5242628.1 malonyl CoA-ACP transacylase [Mycolicibacterium sp. PAM1]